MAGLTTLRITYAHSPAASMEAWKYLDADFPAHKWGKGFTDNDAKKLIQRAKGFGPNVPLYVIDVDNIG